MRKTYSLLISCSFILSCNQLVFSQENNKFSQENGLEKQTIWAKKIIDWKKEMYKVFVNVGNSSDIGADKLDKIHAISKDMLPHERDAIPFLLIMKQNDNWIGSGFYYATKFEPHNHVLQKEPGNLRSNTEEFPDLVEKNVVWDARKVFLTWWLEGGERTPIWFGDRYKSWMTLRGANDAAATQAVYQKLLDVGVAALPLWIQKLEDEKQEETRSQIVSAISELTDGEVKVGSTPEQVLQWWNEKGAEWIVPFPASKQEFIQFLETEAEATGRPPKQEVSIFTAPSVITLSRIEDPAAVDALIRLLSSESFSVRANSLSQLQQLLGEQLPKEYRLGVGTDKWETVNDLRDLSRERVVEVTLNDWTQKMRDKDTATQVAHDIGIWWKQADKTKVVIHWQRAWLNLS